MIRTLRVARTSAVKARAVALTQLKATIKTAPDGLREQLRGLDGAALLDACTAATCPRTPPGDVAVRQAAATTRAAA